LPGNYLSAKKSAGFAPLIEIVVDGERSESGIRKRDWSRRTLSDERATKSKCNGEKVTAGAPN